MQIGPARDQIVRVLQRITLPFVTGETVLKDRLHKELDELRLLAEHLPVEYPSRPVPFFSTPLVEQPAVSTEPPLLPMTNPPTVHPHPEPQMSATSHQPVPQPFPAAGLASVDEHLPAPSDPGVHAADPRPVREPAESDAAYEGRLQAYYLLRDGPLVRYPGESDADYNRRKPPLFGSVPGPGAIAAPPSPSPVGPFPQGQPQVSRDGS